MCAHGIIDKFEECRAVIAATFFVVLGFETPQVSDKVRLPHATSFDLRQVTATLAPFIGAAAVAVRKDERVIENVIEISVAVDDHRRIGQGYHPHRLVTLGVEMLMPDIERGREQASSLPFERVFPAAFIPDRGGALPLKDKHRLLEHMALRLKLLTRSDLLNH